MVDCRPGVIEDENILAGVVTFSDETEAFSSSDSSFLSDGSDCLALGTMLPAKDGSLSAPHPAFDDRSVVKSGGKGVSSDSSLEGGDSFLESPDPVAGNGIL